MTLHDTLIFALCMAPAAALGFAAAIVTDRAALRAFRDRKGYRPQLDEAGRPIGWIRVSRW